MHTFNIGLIGCNNTSSCIATTITKQRDMELIGIVVSNPTKHVKLAARKGYPLYVEKSEDIEIYNKLNIRTHGLKIDLLARADIIIDNRDQKFEQRKNDYTKYNTKNIFIQPTNMEISSIESSLFETTHTTNIILPSPEIIAINRIITSLGQHVSIEHISSTILEPSQDNSMSVAIKEEVERLTNQANQIIKKDISLSKISITNRKTGIITLNITTNNSVDLDSIINRFLEDKRVLTLNDREIETVFDVEDYLLKIDRMGGNLYEVGIWPYKIKYTDNHLILDIIYQKDAVFIPELLDCIHLLKTGKKKLEEINNNLGLLSKGLHP